MRRRLHTMSEVSPSISSPSHSPHPAAASPIPNGGTGSITSPYSMTSAVRTSLTVHSLSLPLPFPYLLSFCISTHLSSSSVGQQKPEPTQAQHPPHNPAQTQQWSSMPSHGLYHEEETEANEDHEESNGSGLTPLDLEALQNMVR
jgi:hypothetical protein